MQHFDRSRQVYQRAGVGMQHSTRQKCHAWAQPFAARRDQPGQGRIQRGAVRVHLGQQPRFHLMLPLLDRIHYSKGELRYCCHIGHFGINRNWQTKEYTFSLNRVQALAAC